MFNMKKKNEIFVGEDLAKGMRNTSIQFLSYKINRSMNFNFWQIQKCFLRKYIVFIIERIY
jgi:hypothetical protein